MAELVCVRKAFDEHHDNDGDTDRQHDHDALQVAQLGVSNWTKKRDMHCVSLFLCHYGC